MDSFIIPSKSLEEIANTDVYFYYQKPLDSIFRRKADNLRYKVIKYGEEVTPEELNEHTKEN